MVEKSELTPRDWWSQLYAPVRHFGEQVAEFFSPSAEASDSREYYGISVELPGVPEDQIQVEVHDGRLTVTGEKRSQREEKDQNYFFSERVYGSFRRVFRLPADADADHISAHHENGVLEIQVPKLIDDTAKPRRIEIGRG